MSPRQSLPSRYTNRPPCATGTDVQRPRKTKSKPGCRPLGVEALEDRLVPAGFSFPDFAAPTGLTLVRDAAFTADHRLRLTPAATGRIGSAWYTAEKQFVGLAFETTFQFQLTENFDPPGGSDGLVFVLQNTAPTHLGGLGGLLGYDGLVNSLAVEFDTFQNSEVNDPSHSHISVHTNGTGPNGWSESLSLGSYSTSPGLLDDGAVHFVKISYAPGALSVYLDDLTAPKLTVAVDLAEKLALDAGKAWVGFTSTTGGGWQNHDILNWTYTVLPDVSTTVWASDASVVEGAANLVFTVTRAGDTSGTTTVNWTTENRTATAGSDYSAASGQVVFGPGVTQQTVTISVNGDSASEPHETLALRLSGATGGSVADGIGLGTILNDDVSIAVSDDTATEGSATTRPLNALVPAGLGGLHNPWAMVVGPDGHLYVSSVSGSAVYRYDGATGSPLPAPSKTGAEFVSPGSGGLSGATGIAFGPDGNLYVTSAWTNAVLRFDSATGAFLSTLVATGSGGLDMPRGLAFHNSHVYVTSVGTEALGAGKDSVLRYDATTGAPAGLSGQPGDAVFIPSGSGGLDNPTRVVFGPDGRVYVSSTAGTANSATSNSVLRYDPSTGAPAGVSGQPGDAVFVSPGSGGLDGPTGIVFRPDGYLYVSSTRTNSLYRYQASNGAFVSQVVPSGSGGLSQPIDFVFDANGNLLVTSRNTNEVLRFGTSSQLAFTVSLSFSSAVPVTVKYTTADGTATAGSDFTAVTGTLSFAPGETTRTVLVQTLDNSTGELTEVFSVTLSNPVGASISDAQGVGTVLDNETKFFVVDDATTDRTYEYASGGVSVESYTLNSGNSAPRGAASNAAGDRIWVLDANKKVYVYDTTGALLGSWTAGSLASNALVEGLATNGNDIWIVDARQDRVFRYTNAASLLSGSQNAASSFNLNNGNRAPKGIVTDGTSLWVVDDSSTNKVFKYTLSGTLLGSWTIDPANASPTGITLDPSNPQHLWVVDNGTDRVYQYDNAVTRTSGSQSASASFALAAGNTNPQDIADPPAGTSTERPLDGEPLSAEVIPDLSSFLDTGSANDREAATPGDARTVWTMADLLSHTLQEEARALLPARPALASVLPVELARLLSVASPATQPSPLVRPAQQADAVPAPLPLPAGAAAAEEPAPEWRSPKDTEAIDELFAARWEEEFTLTR